MLSLFILIIEDHKNDSKFELIYNEYHEMLYNIAFGITQNHHDAEEAMQIALFAIAEDIENVKIDNIPMLKSYLYKITKNASIDLLRSKKRCSSLLNVDDFLLVSSSEDISNSVEGDEQYKQIVTASENKLAILKLNDKNVEINGAKKAIKGAVFQKDGIYYIPISEIEEVYNLKISKIEERIVLESLDKKLIVANVNKKTNLKYKPTVLSRTIEKIDSNEKISIAEVGENTIPTGWIKVRTQNGNIGYIQEKNITEKKS